MIENISLEICQTIKQEGADFFLVTRLLEDKKVVSVLVFEKVFVSILVFVKSHDIF